METIPYCHMTIFKVPDDGWVIITINFSVDNCIFYKVDYVSAMALKILTAAGLDEAAAAVLSSDTNVGMSTTVVLLVN